MNRIEALEPGLADETLADFVHPEDPGWIQAPEDMDAVALDAYDAFFETRSYPVAFVARKEAPVDRVARFTWNELAEMLSSPATGPKDGLGWMPVDIEPGPRKGERVRSVSLLCLDIEAETQGQGDDKRVIGPEPPAFAAVQSEIAARNWRAILHTSYSHTLEHPRYRIVLDITRPLQANEVRPLGEHVALLLGLRDSCDLKCLEPARLFYLPRLRSAEDITFQCAELEGAALDVDALLSNIAAIHSCEEQAASRRANAPVNADANDVIGAFNRRWSPAEIIERNGYRRIGNRWLFSGSSTGLPGVVLLPNAEPQRIFSHHAGDPLATGRACDAFDCFASLEHAGDARAAVKAAATELGLSRMQARPSRQHIDPETGEVLEEQTGTLERSSAGQATEPVDLWRHYEAPALPEGLLPERIERFARGHAEVMGIDPAGLAMAALCVCGATITDDIRLQVKRHDPTWTESARIWVGLIGGPSTKKTPIMAAAQRPLKRIDANLMRAYSEARAKYDAIPPKDRKAAQRPLQERRIISDTTIEAAQEVLRDSPRGVLTAQDELSGWFGQMDKYAPGKGSQADRAFWLQAYNGGSYSLNRIARGATYIPNCSISLLGGIQPEPIRAIANDTHDDGLIQRLIPVILRPGQVGRDIPTDATLADYERLIERLDLMRPVPSTGAIRHSESGHAAPLKLSDAARSVRETLEQEHLELAAALENVSPKLASHFGKHDGLFARLCVIWHCVDHADQLHPPAEISGDTARRVAEFMDKFLRPSAIAFYAGLLGMSAGHERLVDLASWVVGAGIHEVKARDVQSSSQSFRHVTAEEVRLLCEKLEGFGWGDWAEPAPKSNKPRFLINPLVHERFADRGRAELERRAMAREIIRSALCR